MEDYEIVKEKVATCFLAADGNRHFHIEKEKYFLKNEKDEILSYQYYCMIALGNDHFAVCDLMSEANFSSDYNEYDIIQGLYEVTTPKMKWGIIRVNRGEEGKIIPRKETVVVPYLYDEISPNNLKTATAMNEGCLTYIELDEERESYGEQLVPCILTHAVPFSTKIDGFAECSIGKVKGYLPRECKGNLELEPSQLLAWNQAIALSNLLNKKKNVDIDGKTIATYFSLTGIGIESEKVLQKKASSNI